MFLPYPDVVGVCLSSPTNVSLQLEARRKEGGRRREVQGGERWMEDGG